MSNRLRYKSKTRFDPLACVSDENLGSFLFDKTRLTTPTTIDNNILRFCKGISPKTLPVFLSINPESWSRPGYCNKNVERMIQLHGGNIVMGYKIWYVPCLYIEAEKHAVWCNTVGTSVDITYNVDGETKVLFLPVPALKTVVAHSYTKPRLAFHPRVSNFIEIQTKNEKLQSQLFDIQRDDTWEGWEKSISFEKWCCIHQIPDI